MGHHDALLRRFNVLHSPDLDEARAAVARRYCDHRLDLVSGRRIDVVHNHVRGGRVSVNVLGYGAEVAINPGELRAFYLLQLPLQGAARIAHRGEEIDANPFCGTLLNPDRPTRMVWADACRKLMVQIDAAYLNRVAAEEIGAALPGRVRFDPKVPLAGDPGRRIRALSLFAARAFDTGRVSPGGQDLALMSLERQLALSFLRDQPSNVSHLLAAARPGCSEAHLKRAVAFIHDQAHENLGLEDIAAAAGVHPRTLQTAFRKSLGVTPIQFLRDVRLDRARFHLMRRHNRASVSEIAYDCGYSHLGRFSRDFKTRFGHAPSQTA
ncbi:MAG: AraC family transcriptional regulator [Silicimonas sp.]|nr:AraC family transcriptional regulator [Silicimonas sp.]